MAINLILQNEPIFIMPEYSTYYFFDLLQKKKFSKIHPNYITDKFANSDKFKILTEIQFSTIEHMNVRKIAKRKYEIDVLLRDGCKYTTSVVTERSVDDLGGMKLLVNDIYGKEFDELHVVKK